MMSKLEIKLDSRPNGVYVMSLAGPADVLNIPYMDAQLKALLERKPARVVFDLQGLTFIASLAIGALIHFRQSASAWNGIVHLCGASDLITNTIKRVRIDALLPVYPTVDAALAAK